MNLPELSQEKRKEICVAILKTLTDEVVDAVQDMALIEGKDITGFDEMTEVQYLELVDNILGDITKHVQLCLLRKSHNG